MSEITRGMTEKVRFIEETLGISFLPCDSYAKMWEFIMTYYDEAVDVNEYKLQMEENELGFYE